MSRLGGPASLIAAAVTAACTAPPPAQLGPPHAAPGWIAPAVAARAVDFHGTCGWGRAPGDPDRYRVLLRVRDMPGGVILVRSTAMFLVVDESNQIGELPSGTRVLGDGPVYDAVSRRKGWAILVRGHAGRICRGYVSASSVVVDGPT